MAPDPVITVDGPDSEHFACTRKVRTVLRCPTCGFRCGAETEHVAGSGLPPELRDVAAWQADARALEASRRAGQIEAMARREYASHQCAA